MWKVERKKRLTDSNFGRICKLRKTTSTAKTVESLLYSNFKGNSATEFGLAHETTAIQFGLVIDKDYPFLACSPDGLIEENAIVEIKSSYKSGDATLTYARNCDIFFFSSCQLANKFDNIDVGEINENNFKRSIRMLNFDS
ncbi:hypothetical protein RI129_003187 [Pyrocoelia pectoralis]|uniref:YqaJ viral recombinase domain-containing protein n=1 Tax=Pyrocoelia pectoralis TaxID=417401 RepID=A0AAN7VGJ1_9COLE